jgi:hypothetical protein
LIYGGFGDPSEKQMQKLKAISFSVDQLVSFQSGNGEMRGFFPFDKLRVRMTTF